MIPIRPLHFLSLSSLNQIYCQHARQTQVHSGDQMIFLILVLAVDWRLFHCRKVQKNIVTMIQHWQWKILDITQQSTKIIALVARIKSELRRDYYSPFQSSVGSRDDNAFPPYFKWGVFAINVLVKFLTYLQQFITLKDL